MKNIKTMMVMLAVLFGLAFTLPASTALETNVLIVKEVNLTIDLDPAFEISEKFIDEDNLQIIVVGNVEDPSAGNVTIMHIPLLVSEKVNPQEFSYFFENIVLGAAKLEGSKEVENFTVTDSHGRDVKVYTLTQPEPSTPSGKNDFAVWYLDEWNYIAIISPLHNATKPIIETLAIAP